MNKKKEALKWYLEGAKDADETSNTNHIAKDFETHFQLKYKRSLGEKIEQDFETFQSGESFYKSFYELKNPVTHMDKEIIIALEAYKVHIIDCITP